MKKLTKKEFDAVLKSVNIQSYEQALNLISIAYDEMAKICITDSVKQTYTKRAREIYNFLNERGHYNN